MAESVSHGDDNLVTKNQKVDFRQFPNQPKNIIFPVDSKSKRRFLPDWYQSFSWIEWDHNVKAVFCHPYRQIFLADSTKYSKSEEAFTITGFANWKKAGEKFKVHESSHSHIFNMEKFHYKISGVNIAGNLNDQYAIERKTATECLERIFTTIRYLARQGLPLRGHIESESNFIQLFELRTNDSRDLQLWLKRKTSWISKDIQEEILELMACDILRNLVKEINKENCYGLIADETADISQVEQLSICFRTADDELNPDEKVIDLYALERCDGRSIFNAIEDILLRLDINLRNFFGMTFDGASSFSSNLVGVGARIQKIATHAVRTHCHMHCVNLAVQDVVKNVSIMRNFLHFANDLIVFLRDSPKRYAIIRNNAIQLENSQTLIRPLCPTRFTMKYHALLGLYKQLDVIIESLSIVEEESNDNHVKSKASGFLRRLGDFDIYFGLLLSLQVFELTDRLSKELQGKEISVGQGVRLVSYSIQELEKMHSVERFTKLWKEVDELRQQHGAEPAKLFRQVKPPVRFQLIQKQNYNEPQDYYAEKYHEIIDLACVRLRTRITDKSLPVLEAVESLITSAWKGQQPDKTLILCVCEHYGEDNIDSRRLESQLISLENQNTNTGITNVTKIIKYIGQDEMKIMVPMVLKLLKYYLVCPASTANAERSFSQLRRLKTYLRSTMKQSRLNSLLILSTYKEEMDNLDIKKLLKEFIKRKEVRQSVFDYQ